MWRAKKSAKVHFADSVKDEPSQTHSTADSSPASEIAQSFDRRLHSNSIHSGGLLYTSFNRSTVSASTILANKARAFYVHSFFTVVFATCTLLTSFPFIMFFINLFQRLIAQQTLSLPFIAIISLTYWALFTLVFIPVMVMFYFRRDCHPIQARSPVFLTILSIAIYVVTSWASGGAYLQYELVFDDAFTHWIYNLGYTCIINPYLFRSIRLYLVFQKSQDFVDVQRTEESTEEGGVAHLSADNIAGYYIQKELLSDSNSPTSNGDKSGALTPENHSLNDVGPKAFEEPKSTERYLFRWWIIFMLPFVILSIFETLFLENEYRRTFYEYFFPVFHIIEIVTLGVSVFVLRKVWDEFSIKQEIIIVFWISLALEIITLIYFLTGQPSTQIPFSFGHCRRLSDCDRETSFDAELLILAQGSSLFVVSIVWPLFKTFFEIPVPQFPNREAIGSLYQILEDSLSCQYFQRYMIESRNAKLLKCWTECELFHDFCLRDPASTKKEAKRIISTYFAPEPSVENYPEDDRYSFSSGRSSSFISDDEVSLNYAISDTCRQTVWFNLKNACNQYVLDEVQQQIFEWMENHCYRLFLQSKECTELLREIDRKEEMFGRLIGSKFI